MIGMCKRRNVSLQYFDPCFCGSMAMWLGMQTGAKESGFTFNSAPAGSLSLYNAVTTSVAQFPRLNMGIIKSPSRRVVVRIR